MFYNFNINGDAIDETDFAAIVEFSRLTKPSTVMVMDNMYRMWQLQSAAKSEFPIFRLYNPFGENVGEGHDNYFHQRFTPKQAADRLRWYIESEWSKFVPRDFLYTLYYEFGVNEPNDWFNYQKWIIEFATICKNYNIKTTSGGLAVAKNLKSIEWVENGSADDYIKFAQLNESHHLVTIHEYTTGCLWGLNQGGYPSSLLNPTFFKDGYKTTKIDWENYNPDYGINWHLGRASWITNIRAKKIGNKQPLRFVLTEGLFDWMDDIVRGEANYIIVNGQTINIHETIKAKWGIQEFNYDFRGVLGHRNYFAAVEGVELNKYTREQYYAFVILNLKWYMDNAPSNMKGVNLFAANKLWRTPRGHDYTHPNYLGVPFITYMTANKNSLTKGITTPQPTPIENYCFPTETTNWLDYSIEPVGDWFNVRGCYSTLTPVIAQIFEKIQVQVNINKMFLDDKGFKWYPVRSVGNSGFSGWIREDVVHLEPIIITPPVKEIENMSVTVKVEKDNEDDLLLFNSLLNIALLHNEKYK